MAEVIINISKRGNGLPKYLEVVLNNNIIGKYPSSESILLNLEEGENNLKLISGLTGSNDIDFFIKQNEQITFDLSTTKFGVVFSICSIVTMVLLIFNDFFIHFGALFYVILTPAVMIFFYGITYGMRKSLKLTIHK